MQYRMFSSIPDLYLIDASSTSPVKTESPPGGKITPGYETLLYNLLESSSSMWSKQILIDLAS